MTTMTVSCSVLFAALLTAAGEGPAAFVNRVPPPGAELSVPEPGLAYGPVEGFTAPKTIVFSVGPEELEADAEAWAAHGVTAFFLDFIAREWSSDIWAQDGKPIVALVPEYDDYLRPAEARERFAAIPHATLIAVEGGKHLWVGENQTRRVLTEIVAAVNPDALPLATTWGD